MANYTACILSCFIVRLHHSKIMSHIQHIIHSIYFAFCHPCHWLRYTCIYTVYTVYCCHPLFSLCVVFFCFFFSVCLNLILIPPPAAQNTNTNADFANFDAFGSTSGSTSGFTSAPQATFQLPTTGRARFYHKLTGPKTLAFIIVHVYIDNLHISLTQTTC